MRVLLIFLASSLAWAFSAQAHPHVWISTKAELVYGPDGKIAAVRHAWTIDAMNSASWFEGSPVSGPTPEKLAELTAGMKEFVAANAYFTTLRANGTKPAFAEWRDEKMTVSDGRATLHFELPLKEPAAATRMVVLTVSDPSFFVDFQTAPDADAVKLDGAPAGCVLTISRPKQQVPPTQSVGESLFKSLADASSFASQFTSRSTVACP